MRMDRSQVLTRVSVEGRGSRLLSHVAIGDTMLPLDTVEMFELASDVFLKASFQGSEGGASYLTFTGPRPGRHRQSRRAWRRAAGRADRGAGDRHRARPAAISTPTRSTPRPAKRCPRRSAAVDVGATFAAPAARRSPAALQSPTGVDPGSHNWAYTYVTQRRRRNARLVRSPRSVDTATRSTPTGGISQF